MYYCLKYFSLEINILLRNIIVIFILFQKHKVIDLLRTVVEHIAHQFVIALTLPLINTTTLYPHSATEQKVQKVLFTGGGALNGFLMKTIARKFQEATSLIKIVECNDEDTINFKEALIFAFLGLRTLKGLTNIHKSVTGAKQNSVSGSIHLPAKSRSSQACPFDLNKLTSAYKTNLVQNGKGNAEKVHRKSWTLYS